MNDESLLAAAEPLNSLQADPQVLTVSALNQQIRGLLEGEFPLVWLKGEISNFKPHSSGHFYFAVKDQRSQISAVMFRGFNTNLKFRPQDGMEVMIRGRVTVYEPRGSYQIFCEVMEPVGQGALQMAFEQLKRRLQMEGLFEISRKKAIPAMPRRVAIVTSPTGAAIRDMLTVLSRRFKGLEITIFPAAVQGANAPREITAAILLANKIAEYDVMIVGRGGGSMEDLWAFNDENVVRAIAASLIPTVSAVGHEVDFTIADFVADLRAPTPSAAAELIVKNASDLAALVEARDRQLKIGMSKRLQMARYQAENLNKRLVDPQRRLMDLSLRADELTQRLENATQRHIDDQRSRIHLLRESLGTPRARLELLREKIKSLHCEYTHRMTRTLEMRAGRLRELGGVLDSLSPLKVVDRGYSLVTINGTLVKEIAHLKVGDSVEIQFARGQATAKITGIGSPLTMGEQMSFEL